MIFSFILFYLKHDSRPDLTSHGQPPSQAHWQEFHMHTTGFELRTLPGLRVPDRAEIPLWVKVQKWAEAQPTTTPQGPKKKTKGSPPDNHGKTAANTPSIKKTGNQQVSSTP
jgi:hypothetical protein